MWDKVGMARNAEGLMNPEIAALKSFIKMLEFQELIKVQSRIKKATVLPIS
jgi:hypothetical protein